MGLFSKKKEVEVSHQHPAVHQHLVAVSFGHVRKDVQNLYEWIRYLHTQNKAQQDLINHLSRQLQSHAMKSSALDEKALAHIQELRTRIFDMDKKMSSFQAESVKELKSEPSSASSDVLLRMNQLVERLENRPSQPSSAAISSLQEKVAKKVQQNSKEYIKNVIRGLIQKYAKISGLQLREIVVDEQGLCSRSSFYRLLSEVETEGSVNVLPSGKEKVYQSPSEAVISSSRNL